MQQLPYLMQQRAYAQQSAQQSQAANLQRQLESERVPLEARMQGLRKNLHADQAQAEQALALWRKLYPRSAAAGQLNFPDVSALLATDEEKAQQYLAGSRAAAKRADVGPGSFERRLQNVGLGGQLYKTPPLPSKQLMQQNIEGRPGFSSTAATLPNVPGVRGRNIREALAQPGTPRLPEEPSIERRELEPLEPFDPEVPLPPPLQKTTPPGTEAPLAPTDSRQDQVWQDMPQPPPEYTDIATRLMQADVDRYDHLLDLQAEERGNKEYEERLKRETYAMEQAILYSRNLSEKEYDALVAAQAAQRKADETNYAAATKGTDAEVQNWFEAFEDTPLKQAMELMLPNGQTFWLPAGWRGIFGQNKAGVVVAFRPVAELSKVDIDLLVSGMGEDAFPEQTWDRMQRSAYLPPGFTEAFALAEQATTIIPIVPGSLRPASPPAATALEAYRQLMSDPVRQEQLMEGYELINELMQPPLRDLNPWRQP